MNKTQRYIILVTGLLMILPIINTRGDLVEVYLNNNNTAVVKLTDNAELAVIVDVGLLILGVTLLLFFWSDEGEKKKRG